MNNNREVRSYSDTRIPMYWVVNIWLHNVVCEQRATPCAGGVWPAEPNSRRCRTSGLFGQWWPSGLNSRHHCIVTRDTVTSNLLKQSTLYLLESNQIRCLDDQIEKRNFDEIFLVGISLFRHYKNCVRSLQRSRIRKKTYSMSK